MPKVVNPVPTRTLMRSPYFSTSQMFGKLNGKYKTRKQYDIRLITIGSTS